MFEWDAVYSIFGARKKHAQAINNSRMIPHKYIENSSVELWRMYKRITRNQSK